jgi:hypothetical protein
MKRTTAQNSERLSKLIEKSIEQGMDPSDEASISRAFDSMRPAMDDDLRDYCFTIGVLRESSTG